MKNVLTILIIGATFTLACQSNNTKTINNDSTVAVSNQIDSKQCFQYIGNRDTALLNLNINKDQVTGSLSYKLFEKDKNNGVVAGIIKGDTIIADYTFNSEGTASTRQVVWLKKNNQLVEGFGDVEEVDGKTKFKNISKLSFEKSMIFGKINCN